MNDPLEELEKRFDILIEVKDPEKFSLEFIDYLLFIDETAPLNTIARNIFNKSFSPVSKLYQAVKDTGQEHGYPRRKIWLDLMLEIESLRPFIRTFHMQMVEGAKQANLTKKKTLVLHLKEARICLLDEKPRCYSMRLAKGAVPERFEIIIKLLRTKTGKSAGDFVNVFDKTGKKEIAQGNIKKEIQKINKRFQIELNVGEELITHTESRGKNIYFLNKESFIFQTEK